VLVSRDVVPHPEKEVAVYDLPGLEDQLRALGDVE